MIRNRSRINSARLFVIAVGTLSLSISALAQAHAQGTGLPAPAAADYATAGGSFLTAIAPIVAGLIPFGAAALAIMFGPRVLKRMVKMFAGG